MSFLTSLRGIAAIWVVFYHIREHLDAGYITQFFSNIYSVGYLAVDFFFVLSGFVIALNYYKCFINPTLSQYKIFVYKRLSRIFPLHFFMLICYCSIPLAHVLTNRDFDPHLYSATGFILKFLLLDTWFIGAQYWQTWNVPSWTISAEFFSYLMFPFLIYFVWRLPNRLKVTLFFSSILAFSILLFSIESVSIGDKIESVALLRCLVSFFCGICVFFLYSHKKLSMQLTLFISLFIIAVVGGAYYFGIPNYVYMPLGFSWCLYWLVSYKTKLHTILESKYLVYLGEISYSIYLSHTFIRDFFAMIFLGNGQAANGYEITFYIVITIIFSAITYELVEKKARYYLNHIITKSK